MNLYHYCSLETLLSIISKKEIWLSDLSKTNDEKEDIFLFELFSKYLKGCGFDRLAANWNMLEFRRARKSTKIFGLSLTELEDDPIMWQIYCRNNGAMIEFDQTELNNWLAKIKYCSGAKPINLCKIKYYGGSTLDKNDASDVLNDILSKTNSILECYEPLAENSYFIKSNYWAHEKEARIAFRLLDGCYYIEYADIKIYPDYIVKDSKPVFHFAIPFDLKMIKSIKLSPTSSIDSKELKIMLNMISEKQSFSNEPFDDSEISVEENKYAFAKNAPLIP